MPPKQVYGKRTAAKPGNAYARFISLSPEKEDGAGGDKKKTRRAAKHKEADFFDLTREMDGLRVEEMEMEVSQKPAEKNPTRKATETNNITKPSQAIQPMDSLAILDDLAALDINKGNPAPRQTRAEREDGCRSTVQRHSGTSPSKNAKKSARDKKTVKSENNSDEQTCSATPTRTRKPKAAHMPNPKSMSRPPTPDLTSEQEDPFKKHVSPLLSLQSYGRDIVPFKQWSASLEPHFTVSKIAEASFSEVYRLSALKNTCRSLKESVLKLVPLRSPPDLPLRSQSQSRTTRIADVQNRKEEVEREEEDSWKSHVEDVYSEVKLLQNLNYIPGFTNFRDLTILQGRASKAFIDAWKSWNKARPRGKKSEFPDPGKKASYDDTQLWAVIEMQDAGTDVEKVMNAGGLSTVWEVWDVFWGVCLSVAKAEEACRFEHRDLHLENICIRSSRSEKEEDLVNPIIRNSVTRKLGFTGLETTVIDYTLSRADVSPQPSRRFSSTSRSSTVPDLEPGTPPGAQEVAFLDLNKDMALFAGDASEEYQYEIYRYMRSAVLYDDPLSSGRPNRSHSDDVRRSPRKTPQHIRFDDHDPHTPSSSPRKPTIEKPSDPPPDVWRAFHPKTNLVWAHFILYKLLEHLQGNEPANLSSRQVMRNVEAPAEEKSKVVRKALRLYKVLEKVAKLLDPGALAREGALGSVKEMVVLAMEEGWLRVGDVAGEEEGA